MTTTKQLSKAVFLAHDFGDKITEKQILFKKLGKARGILYKILFDYDYVIDPKHLKELEQILKETLHNLEADNNEKS